MKSYIKIILLKSLPVLFFFLSSNTFAAQVSQAQIEQFKRMSPTQQKAIAQQMGVDISSFTGGSSNVSSAPAVVETPVQPRPAPVQSANAASNEQEFSTIESQKKLVAFGYDVFANAPSTFNPISNIAIPEGYIIGVGDQISLQMFGKESNQYILDVSREGQIIIPDLGPYQVVGLSFAEMKRYLVSQIKERIIGVDAVVSLSQLRSIRVFVLGDAYKPGPYTISSLSSITHALFTAGGVSDIGSLRNIQLKRSGKLIQTFDLYDLLINGDSSKDVLLQSGDVVFIAPKGRTVSVAGEVRRPAIYELANNNTIGDVLNMAGGVLPNAYKNAITIERFEQSLRTVLNLDLTDNNSAALMAKDGDYINVMEKSQMYSDSVTIVGAVTRPGKYQWQQGIKVSDLIKDIDTSVLKHADLTYSLIVREIDLARNIAVHQFSIAKALTNVNSNDNIVLQPRDKVVVFSKVEKSSEELVNLDSLAFTEKDLFAKEKQLAKEKNNDNAFWQKYGAEEAFKLSVNDISSNESVSIREQSIFSRQRLLSAINQQLLRQSASGTPLQLVEIDGQVKFPGTYPLTVNSRVSDLVIAAGGVTESAYLTRIDVTRNSVESLEAKKENIQLNLAEALNQNEQANILLASKDRLHIHQIPSWSQNHVIELRGEFVFPGKYTIQRGDTLSSIIKRAGGFTDYAYIDGSIFTREKLKQLEQENITKLTENLRVEFASKTLTEDNGGSYAESQQLLNDLTKTTPIGRLVIQLDQVISDNDYDVLLESGDVLYVPGWKNSVNVIGQVQVTSSHIYEPKLNAQDYIKRSGGMKKRADDDRVYIIAANGSVTMLAEESWFSEGANYTMRPGDTVVVPLDSDYSTNLSLWTAVTQIIYNSAVAVAAVSGI